MIQVLVHTDGGQPVEPCRLELLRDADRDATSRIAARGAVDGAGHARFEGLRPGTYYLRVVPGSLPEGLLAPHDQESAPAVQIPGFHLAPAVVRAGEVTEVRLLVHRAAGLQGYVRGPTGAPWNAGQVRLNSRTLSHVTFTVEPDGAGFYDFGPLVPGTYGVDLLELSTDPGPRAFDSQCPPLSDAVLLPGTVQRLDIDLGPGPVALVGRVVDEHGQAMANLSVRVAYGQAPSPDQPIDPVLRASTTLARVYTDAEGRFEVPGVHRTGTWITPGVDECRMDARYGENRLARYGSARFHDLATSSGRHDAGTLVVFRSRPFRVRGVIELDPDWAADRRSPAETLKLEARFETPRGGEHGHFPGIRVDFDPASGAFEWWCESFHAQVVFTVRHPSSDPRVELPFQPFEGGDLEDLRVRFPR